MYTPILARTINCPKCQSKTMRNSIPQKFGKEYFCDRCHSYFGNIELVNRWGYDVGDLRCSGGICKKCGCKKFSLSALIDEPIWKSLHARDLSYEVVDRMIRFIEEWENCGEDYNPLNDYPYPMGAIGTC